MTLPTDTAARLPGRATRRMFNTAATGLVLALAAATLAGPARAAPVDDAVAELQRDWDTVQYQTPPAERAKRFEALIPKAHAVAEAYPQQAAPLVWEGVMVSSLAGEKPGLGALGLVKQAKALFEAAIRIDGTVLDGSAYNSLGVLYYKVPGWPMAFGDKDKARELLQKALSINPNGMDPNYFYGELLVESRKPEEAIPYLEKALQAPPRPSRPAADASRREEARALLDKIRR